MKCDFCEQDAVMEVVIHAGEHEHTMYLCMDCYKEKLEEVARVLPPEFGQDMLLAQLRESVSQLEQQAEQGMYMQFQVHMPPNIMEMLSLMEQGQDIESFLKNLFSGESEETNILGNVEFGEKATSSKEERPDKSTHAHVLHTEEEIHKVNSKEENGELTEETTKGQGDQEKEEALREEWAAWSPIDTEGMRSYSALSMEERMQYVQSQCQKQYEGLPRYPYAEVVQRLEAYKPYAQKHRAALLNKETPMAETGFGQALRAARDEAIRHRQRLILMLRHFESVEAFEKCAALSKSLDEMNMRLLELYEEEVRSDGI